MANLLSKAIRRHHASLAKAAGVVAAISLDGSDVTLRIVPLRAGVQPTDIGEQVSTEREAQWGIAADELVINSVKVEPQDGMEIRIAAQDDVGPGAVGRYRVVPGPNGRCFDVMDQLGLLYRVYTVYKGPVSD